jgi:hypothetical protein
MMTNYDYNYDSRVRSSHSRCVPACFALVLATAACGEPSPPGSDLELGGETTDDDPGDAETTNTTVADTGDGDGDTGAGDGDGDPGNGDGDGDTGDGDGDTGDGDGDGDPIVPDDSLYPLVDGAQWSYVVTTTGGQVLKMDHTQAHEITWNGSEAWEIVDEPNDEGKWNVSVLVRIGDLIARVHREEMVQQNKVAILDYDPGFARVSDAWTTPGLMEELFYDRIAYDGDGLNPDIEARGHTFEVLAVDEEVTVPAGTFDCVKIERVRTVGTESGALVWYWYAPGVGKVREERPDEMEIEELLSVSIPGGVELP